jgi:non-specific serine/threonine protein kinase
LQVQLTSFVGREDDLAALDRLVSTYRLVTLTGVGGCGKTRLSIELANSVRGRFADGVWLVDLAPLRDPALVTQLVAQVLGLPLASDAPLLESLLYFLQAKETLLILDNCEHLSDACAQLVTSLLPNAPGLRILATSREALGIRGEGIYPLSGLAWPAEPPAAAVDGQALMGFDAVRLFVIRAQASAPSFQLTPENAAAVVEICRRLDGLPLGLELASARVNVLTVQEIAARLSGRFAFLSAGPRSGYAQRHQTLHALIDWSYALLSAEEQTLLRRLAVFEAGFTLDTAEAVCAAENEPVIQGLSSLVSKSLVVADTTGRAQARYRLLETIREYAQEKLEDAGETQTLRSRHLDLFLARAEEAAPRLNDDFQGMWLNWLEGELDNIRAALVFALESGSIEQGLRITSAIVRFWEIRGYVQEGLSWFQRLLLEAREASSPRAVAPVVLANACSMAAFLAMFLDDAAATCAYGQAAVAAAETAVAESDGEEARAALVTALGAYGSGARVSRDFQTAREIGERAIGLLREMPGQPFLLCMSLISMGSIAMELGSYAAARAYLNEGLSLAQADGDPFRTAHALNELGDVSRCEHKYAEACAYYERSAALLRDVNAQRDLASILRNLAHACLRLGRIERAHALLHESIAIQQTLRNMPGIAECLVGFAALAIQQNLLAAGARLLAASATAGGKHVTVASNWLATRMEVEYYTALARAGLSPANFLEDQAVGRAMSFEQAVELALSLPGQAAPSTKKAAEILTTREREVALLISQGKTNGEIAQILVLSKRTVETHVNNILAKLGLSHRAQIMRWAIDQGLPAAQG